MDSKENVTLESYLLSQKVDLNVSKSGLFDDRDSIEAASTVWSKSEDAIRLVVEHRMQLIRKQLIVSCMPVEVLPLRTALKELGSVLEDFEKAKVEQEKYAKELADKPEVEDEEEPESDEDNSSL